MKASLKVGSTGTLTTEVGPGNTIRLGDDRRAEVFSTPSMINLMEYAAREAVRPHLDEGEESVGIDVQIQHTAATPPRSQVTAEAVVARVEKNVITFEVVARDPWGEIGRGTHRRAIIATEKFARKLAESKAPQPQPGVSSSQQRLPAFKAIECTHADSTLSVTLNRPHKRNAMSQQMTHELGTLLQWLESSGASVRCVVVRGAGDTFCAGDDVGDLPQDPVEGRALSLLRGETYLRMTELPQVFIAAIDGLALGGGLVLAAACDFRLATHRAKFSLPEVALGWPPNYGMKIVQSIIGRGHTLQLALTGQQVSANQALAMGLVSRVITPDRLSVESLRLAHELSQKSGFALAKVKQLLSPHKTWSDALASDAFVESLATEAAQKSLQRFSGNG
jgi:enoyl-CoA hydratase